MENNLTPDSASTRKRTRMTAFALACSVVINLMFLMYAFVQKSEAERQTALAGEQRTLAVQYQKLVSDLHDHEQELIGAMRKQIDSLKTSCK